MEEFLAILVAQLFVLVAERVVSIIVSYTTRGYNLTWPLISSTANVTV
jgi:hypothetical protein